MAVTGAVVIVGPPAETPDWPQGFHPPLTNAALEAPEMLGGVPLTCVEILGRSAVARFLDRLQLEHLEAVTLVASEFLSPLLNQASPAGIQTCFCKSSSELWRLAGQKVSDLFADGFQTAVVARLGAYIEVEWEDILQLHHEGGESLCQAHDAEGPLDFWVLGRNFMEAMTMEYELPELAADSYFECSYVKRLKSARQLRELAADCLHSRCATRPGGRELKPGVWVDDDADIHRKARVVAPSYIGRSSKVDAAALITRSSSLEHDCEVDGGTVVEDACVLANTYIGRWLDVSHAVVDGSSFIDLRSDVTVEISDGALMRRIRLSDSPAWPGDGQQVNFVRQLGGRMRKALLH